MLIHYGPSRSVPKLCRRVQTPQSRKQSSPGRFIYESTGWRRRYRNKCHSIPCPARPGQTVWRASRGTPFSLSVEWGFSSLSQTACVQLSNSFRFPHAECFPTVCSGLHSVSGLIPGTSRRRRLCAGRRHLDRDRGLVAPTFTCSK